ncbi:PEP-utilizing family enzyme [Serratia plymuthica]|nr:PEP-utilizing family enzyme [Serratia plymuthica]CAI2488621.1 pyruvate, phosphate dikinase [Serratia plymuthica]
MSSVCEPVMAQTKAGMLKYLMGKLKKDRIPDLLAVTYDEWKSGKDLILQEVSSIFGRETNVIVRSSAVDEDTKGFSKAGAYLSEVVANDPVRISFTVDAVFSSYEEINPGNEVFIQRFIADSTAAGVVFTRAPKTGAAYYVTEFEEGGGTDTVTSGKNGRVMTFILKKGFSGAIPDSLGDLFEAIKEIEALTGDMPLDIEFAVSHGTAKILQVRALLCPVKSSDTPTEAYLHSTADLIESAIAPSPYVLGKKGMLGNMPDWNPAEIIGTHPRSLSSSLYRYLITNAVWAKTRKKFGYRDVSNSPLLVMLKGMPYVDVRLSLNSLIPSAVPDGIAEKFIESQLLYLSKNPQYHDKIEFNVAVSCWTPLAEKRINEIAADLSPNEKKKILSSLNLLTKKILESNKKILSREYKKIEKLETRTAELNNSSIDDRSRLYWMLTNCKEYGTYAFSTLARLAFISVDIIKALYSAGFLSKHQHDAFFASISTISSRMLSDYESLTRKKFIELYGHLRPGTYDIRIARYDEDENRYLSNTHKAALSGEQKFILDAETQATITELFCGNDINISCTDFFLFARKAIEGREYAKFIFTKSVSDSLQLLEKTGNAEGISVEEISHADITCILNAINSGLPLNREITDLIKKNRQDFMETQHMMLPPLIKESCEAYSHVITASVPNFIFTGVVEGDVVSASSYDLENKIVGIEQADPGYDWIFTHNIKGFFTAYGGANSHMAIRAAELGIPAVIGAGEAAFERWVASHSLRIDCDSHTVKIIS